MASSAPEARQRLFFALWPDEPVRAALHALAQADTQAGACGNAARRANFHLTLAFAGAVSTPVAACLSARAATLGGPAGVPGFDLVLDHAGAFPQAGIVWLAPTEIPAPLRALAEGLRGVLQDCGVKMERRPFRPHVTLRRHAQGGGPRSQAAPRIVWRARSFALVESRAAPTGPVYHVLHAWPLGDMPS